jgi:hypothetical protein
MQSILIRMCLHGIFCHYVNPRVAQGVEENLPLQALIRRRDKSFPLDI